MSKRWQPVTDSFVKCSFCDRKYIYFNPNALKFISGDSIANKSLFIQEMVTCGVAKIIENENF